MAEIYAYRLHAGKVDQAYPLVRELAANLSLTGWREYAAGYLTPDDPGRERGIIVTEFADCLRGLLSYQILGDVSGRKTLSVRDVIVLGVPTEQILARHLLQHLFAIAEPHRCRAIRVDLAPSMRWIAREWSDPGGRLYKLPITCFVTESIEPDSPHRPVLLPSVTPDRCRAD